MISKLELCLQELEETIYWMELLVEADILGARRVTPLMNESRELVAIFTTSVRKAKANRKST